VAVHDELAGSSNKVWYSRAVEGIEPDLGGDLYRVRQIAAQCAETDCICRCHGIEEPSEGMQIVQANPFCPAARHHALRAITAQGAVFFEADPLGERTAALGVTGDLDHGSHGALCRLMAGAGCTGRCGGLYNSEPPEFPVASPALAAGFAILKVCSSGPRLFGHGG
jgi:hypothetical protein